MKQTKYKKAMKDLDILTMYTPDNMQVVALKLELKGYMSKQINLHLRAKVRIMLINSKF